MVGTHFSIHPLFMLTEEIGEVIRVGPNEVSVDQQVIKLRHDP
jgi:hypothetical protein